MQAQYLGCTKRKVYLEFEIRLSSLSSASLSSGKLTADTVPSLFRRATREFSNNGELQKIEGKEKKRKRVISEWAPSYASCLPRGTQSYQPGSFLPKDAYPSNACPPVLSLILSILYFPTSLPPTITHVTLASVRTPAPPSLSFIQNRKANDHRYPTPATPTPAYREADLSGEDGVLEVILPSLPRTQSWATNR